MDFELLWPVGLTLLLLFGAASDIKARRLANWLSLVLFLFGLAHGFALGGFAEMGWHAAHGVIALLGGMALFAIGAFGGGDAKFYAGMAAYFALSQGVELLVTVALLGGLLIILWMVLRRIPPFKREQAEGLKAKFPYGVAIAAGGILLAWWPILFPPALPGMQ